jgi:hypothetical protein
MSSDRENSVLNVSLVVEEGMVSTVQGISISSPSSTTDALSGMIAWICDQHCHLESQLHFTEYFESVSEEGSFATQILETLRNMFSIGLKCSSFSSMGDAPMRWAEADITTSAPDGRHTAPPRHRV